jgi:hypothetical protein
VGRSRPPLGRVGVIEEESALREELEEEEILLVVSTLEGISRVHLSFTAPSLCVLE